MTAIETGAAGCFRIFLEASGCRGWFSSTDKIVKSHCIFVPSHSTPPAADQGCPSVWYPAPMVAALPINVFKPSNRQGGAIVHTQSMRAARRRICRQRRGAGGAGGLLFRPAAQASYPISAALR